MNTIEYKKVHKAGILEWNTRYKDIQMDFSVIHMDLTFHPSLKCVKDRFCMRHPVGFALCITHIFAAPLHMIDLAYLQ